MILAIGATALEQVDWPDISQNVEIKQKMETTTLDIPAVKVTVRHRSMWPFDLLDGQAVILGTHVPRSVKCMESVKAGMQAIVIDLMHCHEGLPCRKGLKV